jgi:hypothetical protein
MRITTFTKPLAALGLAGALTLGAAGVAAAQDPGTPAEAPSGSTMTFTVECDTAIARHDQAVAHIATWHDRLDRLATRRDALAAKGRTVAADRLTTFIDRSERRLDRVEARMEKLAGAISEQCDASSAGGGA